MLVASPEYLHQNIGSSLAVYTYLARSVERCKADISMEFFMSSLGKLVPRVCPYIGTEGATVDLGNGSIAISRDGQVAGFNECLSHGIHMTGQSLLRNEPWITKQLFYVFLSACLQPVYVCMYVCNKAQTY